MYTVLDVFALGHGFYITHCCSDNLFQPSYFNVTSYGYSSGRYVKFDDSVNYLIATMPFHWLYYDHEDFYDSSIREEVWADNWRYKLNG